MPILDVRMWSGLGLTDRDVDLLRGRIVTYYLKALIGLIEYAYHQGIPSFLKV
jgi:hypothetical protein